MGALSSRAEAWQSAIREESTTELHVVVVTCHHDVSWLQPLCAGRSADQKSSLRIGNRLGIPRASEIFLYAKCGFSASAAALASNCSNARIVPADNHGRDFKVYLTHVVSRYHSLPSSVIFVHDDFSKHQRLARGEIEPPPFFGVENWRELGRCFDYVALKHPCNRQEVWWRGGRTPRLCQRYRLGRRDETLGALMSPNRVNDTEVAETMARIAGALLPPSRPLPRTFTFFENAQILVGGARLRRLPLDWYRRAAAFVDAIGLEFAPIYALERTFHLLLDCESSACARSGGACGAARTRRYAELYAATADARAAAAPAAHAELFGRRTCVETLESARRDVARKLNKTALCKRAADPATAAGVRRATRTFCRQKLPEMLEREAANARCAVEFSAG